jgi:hypothetical protein
MKFKIPNCCINLVQNFKYLTNDNLVCLSKLGLKRIRLFNSEAKSFLGEIMYGMGNEKPFK